MPSGSANGEKQQRRHLVQTAAAKMREMIMAQAPDTQIGSLTELAQTLGVGIVTIQQAARVLEHEGMLEVRRGPRGGYYGMRPDAASLKRSMEAYLQTHGSDYPEALEVVSWLDCELIPIAARCKDEAAREALRDLAATIDDCNTPDDRVAFELQFHDVLFRMVDRPLIELLCRATMRYYSEHPVYVLFPGEDGTAAWKRWRRVVLRAVLEKDEELARYEAMRHRDWLLKRLHAIGLEYQRKS